MLCRNRAFIQSGMYYVSRRAEPPQVIFSKTGDYDQFEVFLAETLEHTRTQLLGYCWMPDSIHLALNVVGTPLGEVMRKVTRYCTDCIRERTGEKASYTDTFPIALPEPEEQLPMLLRYIHCIPVIAGIASSPAAYLYTSHRTYTGGRQDELRTTPLQKLIHIPRTH